MKGKDLVNVIERVLETDPVLNMEREDYSTRSLLVLL